MNQANPKKYFRLLITSVFVVATMAGCNRTNGKHYTDTPTSGKISIAVDDSYQPIVDAQIQVFQALYPYAKIHPKYEFEKKAVSDLIKDSVRLIVISRKLVPSEKAYFDSIHLIPRQTKIAIDALALIVNNNNADTLLTVPQLKDIFSGRDSTWEQLDKKSKLGKISVVFDHTNSSNARYVFDNLTDNAKKFPDYCFAENTDPQVVDYVSKNANSIGVIGVNWISDDNDKMSIGFLEKVKVVALSKETSSNPDDYYKPYQAYMKLGTYPLCRSVYIISREARAGLGTGFASFVAGDKGQRIILKAGLVPATAPTRVVQIDNN